MIEHQRQTNCSNILFLVISLLLEHTAQHFYRIKALILSGKKKKKKEKKRGWVLKKKTLFLSRCGGSKLESHDGQDKNSGWCRCVYHSTCPSLIPNRTPYILFWSKNRRFT